MVRFVKLLHPSNAELPIILTPSPIDTHVSPAQPENADDPMLVTLLGIVTFSAVPA